MPRIDHMDPNDLTVDPNRPTYQPLTDALVLHMRGGANPERRVVPVADLQIALEFRVPEEYVQIVVGDYRSARLLRQEMMTRIPVMERQDGTLWVYDNCVTVQAMWRVDPAATIACYIYKDPTQ